jgi:hypothetical protein
MLEHELDFPLACPICFRESLSGFRIGVLADPIEVCDIPLYVNCHVVSWDASKEELLQMRDYVVAACSENLQEACHDCFNSSDLDAQGAALAEAGTLINENPTLPVLHKSRAA